jgi:hypothetical protein
MDSEIVQDHIGKLDLGWNLAFHLLQELNPVADWWDQAAILPDCLQLFHSPGM